MTDLTDEQEGPAFAAYMKANFGMDRLMVGGSRSPSQPQQPPVAAEPITEGDGAVVDAYVRSFIRG